MSEKDVYCPACGGLGCSACDGLGLVSQEYGEHLLTLAETRWGFADALKKVEKAAKAGWDEALHPRGAGGEFTSKGGGGATGTASKAAKFVSRYGSSHSSGDFKVGDNIVSKLGPTEYHGVVTKTTPTKVQANFTHALDGSDKDLDYFGGRDMGMGMSKPENFRHATTEEIATAKAESAKAEQISGGAAKG